MASTRKFNGKVYRFYEYDTMKSSAIATVKRLRRQGKSARYTPAGAWEKGWNIWVRG